MTYLQLLNAVEKAKELRDWRNTCADDENRWSKDVQTRDLAETDVRQAEAALNEEIVWDD